MNDKRQEELTKYLKGIDDNLNAEIKDGKVNINYGCKCIMMTDDQDDIDFPKEEVIINEITYYMNLPIKIV